MRHQKEVFSIYVLTGISLIGLLPLMFTGDFTSFFGFVFDNNDKIDVYLFSDRLRYPENVAYDIIEMITMCIMIWTIKSLSDIAIVRDYISCFLYVSLINIAMYFINCNQYSSFVTMPILIGMLFIVKFRNK